MYISNCPRTVYHSLHGLSFPSVDYSINLTINLSLRYRDAKRKTGFSMCIPGISWITSRLCTGVVPSFCSVFSG